MADFVIHLPDVDEDGRDYRFKLEPEWLSRMLADAALRPDPRGGPGDLSLHAQKSGRELLLDGRVRAKLLAECCRCLGDAPVVIDSRMTALFVPAGTEAKGADPVELEPEDLDRVPYVGNDVALDDLVRGQLVLECPMQPLCTPDCPGIEIPAHVRPPEEEPAAQQGDPRLAPLRELRSRLRSGGQ